MEVVKSGGVAGGSTCRDDVFLSVVANGQVSPSVRIHCDSQSMQAVAEWDKQEHTERVKVKSQISLAIDLAVPAFVQ